MNGIKRHLKCRSTLAPIVAAFISLIGAVGPIAHAVTLPPPPVSPAPVTDYEYDAKGNPTKVIKAKGVSGFGFATTNAYDPLDRVKTSTDARNGVTALGYDGIDQLKQVTDPRSLVTSYQRNGLGDLTQLVSPDTGMANSTYDAVGNLLTRTDSRGVLATYGYDALDRMTSAVYTQSSQTTQNYAWTYDQTGGDFGAGIGRLTTATGTAGNTKYGYDAKGRVITVIQTVGVAVFTTRYGYDVADHVISITYPSGRVLTIQYDAGLPVSMSVAKDAWSAAQPLISDIQFEPFGGVRSWQMQMNSGTKLQERVFDQYGRIVRYSLNSRVRDITYDAADRIVSYTHLDATTGQATAEAQSLNQSFGYDELGRLTGIVTPTSSWSIGYDANGNRTGVTLNGTARTYATEATSNRLTSISNPTRGFGYDAMGNTLSDTGLAYTTSYGLDGRMGTITKAGVTTTYSYDAGGQRVRKVSGSTTTHFNYDQNGQLLGQYSGTTPSQEYVWLGGIPVAALHGASQDPEVLYVFSDHLGAPRVMIDKNNGGRWRWISEPFGTTAPEEAPGGLAAVTLNLRFPGQYFDKESGLSYNYFRDYDGTTGRYVQSDPIGLAGGINSFAYVNGSPLMGIDAVGLQTCVFTPAGGICKREPSVPIDPSDPRSPTLPNPALPAPDLKEACKSSLAPFCLMLATMNAAQNAAEQMCGNGGDDDENRKRCEKGKAKASGAYHDLMTKRIPQYQSGGKNGPDATHYASILQKQSALRDGIRLARYCNPLPAELPEWERAANMQVPIQH